MLVSVYLIVMKVILRSDPPCNDSSFVFRNCLKLGKPVTNIYSFSFSLLLYWLLATKLVNEYSYEIFLCFIKKMSMRHYNLLESCNTLPTLSDTMSYFTSIDLFVRCKIRYIYKQNKNSLPWQPNATTCTTKEYVRPPKNLWFLHLKIS